MPQDSSTTELFNQALAQLQQKNWDAAIALYRQLLDQGLSRTQASVVYHNMSTIASEKADVLMAYTWSKKAMLLDPSNSAARAAFGQFSAQFQAPSIPHQISNFDNVTGLISKVPLDAWLLATLTLVLLTIWLAAKQWIQQKKNRLNGIFTTAGKWPVFVALLFSVLLAVGGYFAFSQSEITHGVLIVDKAKIQTAPGQNKPVIFEAPAGLDVEVLRSDDGFYQVRSAGAFSGWVEQSQVELMSLNFGHKK